MRPIRKIQTAAGDIQGRELDFEIVEEPWCRYKLKDGGEVRIRITATTIFQVVDDAGKATYDSNGSLGVFVNYATQIAASD